MKASTWHFAQCFGRKGLVLHAGNKQVLLQCSLLQIGVCYGSKGVLPYLCLTHVAFQQIIIDDNGGVANVEVTGNSPQLCHIQVATLLIEASHLALLQLTSCITDQRLPAGAAVVVITIILNKQQQDDAAMMKVKIPMPVDCNSHKTGSLSSAARV